MAAAAAASAISHGVSNAVHGVENAIGVDNSTPVPAGADGGPSALPSKEAQEFAALQRAAAPPPPPKKWPDFSTPTDPLKVIGRSAEDAAKKAGKDALPAHQLLRQAVRKYLKQNFSPELDPMPARSLILARGCGAASGTALDEIEFDPICKNQKRWVWLLEDTTGLNETATNWKKLNPKALKLLDPLDGDAKTKKEGELKIDESWKNFHKNVDGDKQLSGLFRIDLCRTADDSGPNRRLTENTATFKACSNCLVDAVETTGMTGDAPEEACGGRRYLIHDGVLMLFSSTTEFPFSRPISSETPVFRI